MKVLNNQTHRKSVREGLSEYTAKYIFVDGLEDMSTNGLHRIRWSVFAVARVYIGLATCQFAKDLENIQQRRVVKGVGKVGKRIPSDPMVTV